METKKCSKCGEVKEIDEFRHHWSHGNKKEHGYSTCRQCEYKKARERYAETHVFSEHYLKRFRKTKICKICQIEKEKEKFHGGTRTCNECERKINYKKYYQKKEKTQREIGKKCRRCHNVIKIENFTKEKNICDSCFEVRYKKRKINETPEKRELRLKKSRERYDRNKYHEYYLKHKEKQSIKDKQRYHKNKIKINGKYYTISKQPEEMRPVLQTLIILRDKRRLYKQLKKEAENG
jgi:hypothetical protein